MINRVMTSWQPFRDQTSNKPLHQNQQNGTARPDTASDGSPEICHNKAAPFTTVQLPRDNKHAKRSWNKNAYTYAYLAQISGDHAPTCFPNEISPTASFISCSRSSDVPAPPLRNSLVKPLRRGENGGWSTRQRGMVVHKSDTKAKKRGCKVC